MLSGVIFLIKKEILALVREPKSAFMVFFPVIIFLTIFVFATTKDVSNSSIVILNHDTGRYSRDILDHVVNTNIFKDTYYVDSQNKFNKMIDTEKAFIGLSFNKTFSKDITSGKTANVQIITDGRRTNSAMIAMGYLSQIFNSFQKNIAGIKNTPTIKVRTWYNPNKEPVWFSITNIICMLIVSQTISIIAISIAKEKEVGTFDQLLVSPISPLGMLIGKIMPGVIISLLMSFFVMLVAHFVYGVPFIGSVLLMVISMFIYVLAIAGIGVFISAFARTQQQASLGMFIFMLPISSLSGLMSPTESVVNPIAKAFITCNPLVYANRLVKGIMLKDMSIYDALSNILPLVIIAITLLSISALVFAKTHRIKVF